MDRIEVDRRTRCQHDIDVGPLHGAWKRRNELPKTTAAVIGVACDQTDNTLYGRIAVVEHFVCGIFGRDYCDVSKWNMRATGGTVISLCEFL